MGQCDEVKQLLLAHLEHDIEAHNRGDFHLIGEGQDTCPSLECCRDEMNKTDFQLR